MLSRVHNTRAKYSLAWFHFQDIRWISDKNRNRNKLTYFIKLCYKNSYAYLWFIFHRKSTYLLFFNFTQNSREIAQNIRIPLLFQKLRKSNNSRSFSSSTFEKNNGFFKFYDVIAITRIFSVKWKLQHRIWKTVIFFKSRGI